MVAPATANPLLSLWLGIGSTLGVSSYDLADLYACRHHHTYLYVLVRQVAERRRWSRQQYHAAFWVGTIGLFVLVLCVVR